MQFLKLLKLVTQIREMAPWLDILDSSPSLLHLLVTKVVSQMGLYVVLLRNLEWLIPIYRIKFKYICLVFKAVYNLKSACLYHLIFCTHSASVQSTSPTLTWANTPWFSSHAYTFTSGELGSHFLLCQLSFLSFFICLIPTQPICHLLCAANFNPLFFFLPQKEVII